MKTLFNTALPALALLALGGCATTGAVSSTETDDVYFSSKDRTTYAAQPAPAQSQNQGTDYGSATTQTQVPATEDANPDYQGGSAQQGTSTDYYDDNYTSYNSVQPSGFGQPYTGPGVSTYNYTPSWSVSPMAYASPWGYGTGLSIGYGYGGFGGYSPFSYGYGYPGYGGFYDPFYSSFYSPWGYGTGLSIGFGYGFGGYGGFGYPYYGGFGSPYGYGYGYPGYAYGGGYGGGYGDYGYGRGGARNYVYKQGIMNGSYSNGYDPGAIKVGRRESRYSNAVGSSGVVTPGGATGAGPISNRRAAAGANSGFDRMAAPAGTAPAASSMTNNGQPATMDRGRRFDQNTMNANSPGAAGAYNQPRTADAANPANAGGQPQRRGGFFREVFANPNPNGGQPQGQNNGYSQPQQRSFDQQRAFSQPQQQQRSFEQPQRTFSQPQRSFEQPQRSFSPAPSFGGGGGGGGGSFGGGGGGGGRRGR